MAARDDPMPVFPAAEEGKNMSGTFVKTTGPAIVEIIAVGNELLNGSVRDGNSFWLIERIMDLGGVVGRVSILPDDQDLVAQEVRTALGRAVGKPPEVLLLTGGLGPTVDDLTVAAVAQGMGLPLVMHDQAREMIRRAYDDLAAQGVIAQGGLNPPREKMALLPQGATALANPAGTAPGVLVHAEAAIVVCFPGVPREMEQIFETSLQPHLTGLFPAMRHARRGLLIHGNDESALAPYLQRFAERYPAIHVKARSGIIAENPRLEFLFSTTARDRDAAEALLQVAMDELRVWLEAGGVGVGEAG